MSILDDDTEGLGDIGWTATRQDGVPVLALEALSLQAGLVFADILIENLQARNTTPEEFILIEGFGASPNILLESSIHPVSDTTSGSVESAVAAILAADWNGDPWKLIVQYRNPQGHERSRAWLTQGKTGIRTRLQPGIGTGDPTGVTLFWPVRFFNE